VISLRISVEQPYRINRYSLGCAGRRIFVPLW